MYNVCFILNFLSVGDPITIGEYTFGMWTWAVYLTAPFFILKQTISVVAFFHCIGEIIKYDEDAISKAAKDSTSKKKK